MRLIGKIAAAIGILAILCAIFGWVYLRSALPQISGTVTLEGLKAEVSITRDRHGVPHIVAQTPEDAFFALGYAHAQDRLWQMSMHRRIAAGRLSEIAGEATLSTDVFLRTLSLYDRARKAWAHQTPQARAGMVSYSNGVNAFLNSRKGALPPEFLLTGTEPEPWTPIDSLSWLKVMALDLGGNYWSELARLDLASRLDTDQLMDFFPPYPGEEALPLPDLDTLYDGLDLAHIKTAQTDIGKPRGLGSNNWVISGDHSKTGMPLLANDPHLGLTTPSLWYLAHMNIGGENVIGATMPGIPFVILGRNDRIAWGFTNVNPDVQDLYVEKLVDDGTAYLTPDGPAPFITREETIHIKDAEPKAILVRETRHGPVISDGRADLAEKMPKNAVLALRWTALDEEDTSGSAAATLSSVKNYEQFKTALRLYTAPAQNIVYADIDGNIGYYAPGRVPIRGAKNDTHGLVPAPGWKADYDWESTIPYEDMPERENPANGVIVTANEKIVGPDYPHFLTSGWALPYRGDRIRELIADTGPHDKASMARIQMDVKSTVAADLLPLMLGLMDQEQKALDETQKDILDALGAWDFEMAADRPEPMIFTAWHRALAKRLYADELGDKFDRYWGAKVDFLKMALLGTTKANWCDDIGTSDDESCADRVHLAFNDALEDLSSRLDRTPRSWRDWQWGSLHRGVQEHRPFSQVPVLARFFETSTPAPGGTYTVNVAGPSFSAPDPYGFTHGPSYRVVYDLADLDRSSYIIPTGQSGIPFSKHYSDMMDKWLHGDFVEISTNPETYQSGDKLVLKRQSSGETGGALP
ncbi:penicillin amidase [Iodidimonas muriae]|uniref:Penicillin amidase n=1 Tax=Iodidimonas muriae TaxID=261467 RepID=A0ABQ2LF23_9PROT|nr:penicillin acylase family protein [Iodidimonas muriae]GER07645.1 penicillin amidase [Kordiimonadales bacterium JCM 17843]GGO14519.1 penicillin amidase [Iodidimonas muriae]